MRILITGNMGYVGPVVSNHLRKRFPDAEIVGFDNALFARSLTTGGPLPEITLDAQYFGDVREVPDHLLRRTDAVVHLAAISNDPMGNRFGEQTDAINRGASVRTAQLAQAAGVRHFAFASSCSVYGFSNGLPRNEDDPVDPLTAYAKSKIETETALAALDCGSMTVTCLRFATACGLSPRLRLDLVLNDFVASALTSGEIVVLSDGTPWRPLIHVQDMARALEWAITRSGDRLLVVNAGSDHWNYSVQQLADAVAAAIPGTEVSVNLSAPPDRRSYKVDFSRFRALAPGHQPQITLQAAIEELQAGLRAIGFADKQFRTSPLIRLHALAGLIDSRALSSELRWMAPA
jgi:nucleoside-diphosphate-sugar epimerase